MIYTDKIQKAIKFAIKTHEVYQKQKRKGKDVPYITHPLTAGLILARAGASDDVVAAGILHDTIEDSSPGKRVTREMIAERFGEEVAELVDSVTEKDKDASWGERKSEALEHIKTFSHGSVLVKSADVISNVSEILDDHATVGEEVWKRFSMPKEKVVKNYLRVIAALVTLWPKSPLSEDLPILADKLRTL